MNFALNARILKHYKGLNLDPTSAKYLLEHFPKAMQQFIIFSIQIARFLTDIKRSKSCARFAGL